MSIKSSLIRAKVLYKNKQFLESIDICQELLMKKPKLCAVRQVLALNFKEIKNFEQAIVELNKILIVKPLDAETLSNIGSVYLSKSQFDLASKYFTNAIFSNSTMAVAYSNLAICQQRLGEVEYAEKNYKHAILLGDKTAKAHLGLGTLYTALGKFDPAVKLLVKSLELDPNQSIVYFHIYTVMMHLHRYQDALEVADMGLLSNVLSDIELCELLVGKAILFWLFDNIEEAEKAILLSERVYSEGPNYPNIKNLRVFHGYLKRLVQFRLNNPGFYQNQNQNQIYFISESHGFSPCGATIEYQGVDYQVRSLFMLGAKIFHLIDDKNNKHKESLMVLLQGLPNKSKVVMGFGEIDCRQDEGIFMHCLKTEQDFHIVIEKMVNKYLAMLQVLTQSNDLELIIYGVPAPHQLHVFGLKWSQQKSFKALISYFNAYLAKECQKLGFSFLDVYKLTNQDGVSNLAYHIDEHHLKPETIKVLFNNLAK